MSTKKETGISHVRERITRSQDRIIHLVNANRLRDLDEIWEAYYDVEEAILLSKIIFGGFDKPGKTRKLNVPTNFDFLKLSESEIRAKFESVGKCLSVAEGKLAQGSEDDMIEFLRRARDELKVMLLSPNRTSKKAPATRRTRRRIRT